MKRVARSYARALFPRSAKLGADHAPGNQVPGIALTPDGLDLSIAGGVYRLVCAVEGLLGKLRQQPRPTPASSVRVPTATRVGCG
jgi:hypothetical protein